MLTGGTLVAWPEVDLSVLQSNQAEGTSRNWLLIGFFILVLALLCYWLLQERSAAQFRPSIKPAHEKQ